MRQVRASDAGVVIALLCAVVTTLLVVRRELFGRTPQSNAPVRISDEDWSALATTGHSVGPQDAPLRIVVFADFQCPACRDFVLGPLASVRASHPGKIHLVYRHWPLPYHRHARDMAAAGICASRFGAFERFHDLAYAQQDSIGIKTPLAFGAESGVQDSAAFEACLREPGLQAEIDLDITAVKAIGGTGTPTVIASGYRYLGYPGVDELEELLAERE